jgi:hypothetical protein
MICHPELVKGPCLNILDMFRQAQDDKPEEN